MEFIIDKNDNKPKIIDVNPRFYGPVQCAISAGVDLPFDLTRMAIEGDIEADFSYQAGIRCRHLLFDDIKHLFSVFRGGTSLKYDTRKIPVLLNFLNFRRRDAYFFISRSDPMPALKKILRFILFPADYIIGYIVSQRIDVYHTTFINIGISYKIVFYFYCLKSLLY